jgi:hypothetical protein
MPPRPRQRRDDRQGGGAGGRQWERQHISASVRVDTAHLDRRPHALASRPIRQSSPRPDQGLAGMRSVLVVRTRDPQICFLSCWAAAVGPRPGPSDLGPWLLLRSDGRPAHRWTPPPSKERPLPDPPAPTSTEPSYVADRAAPTTQKKSLSHARPIF